MNNDFQRSSLCAALVFTSLLHAAPDHIDENQIIFPEHDACAPRWFTGPGSPGFNGSVHAMTVFDDGTGPALYAGGSFTVADGASARRIAKWDGSSWSPLGNGMNNAVQALAVFDDGNGPALYAGGVFSQADGSSASRIAKWNGTSWSTLGSGMNMFSIVYALAVFDDGNGPALYAGGTFTEVNGVPANRIARWDGATWSLLGSGMNASVRALTVHDDGSGPALYAGGAFTVAGDAPVNQIAKWDGTSWSALGSGVTGGVPTTIVESLVVFDDGEGPELIVGGSFFTAGDVMAIQTAKWNGTSWSALGIGMSCCWVKTLAVFDDGDGPALYAGGQFVAADKIVTNGITRWDGEAWGPLGSGVQYHAVNALTVFDDGSGPALFVGGGFNTAGGEPAHSIAKWQRCTPEWNPCSADLNCDGVVSLSDLLIMLSSWGPNEACRADINGDGIVDLSDLQLLLAAWGACP